MWRIVSVKALPGYRLEFEFADGVRGVLDYSQELWGPVFEPLKDPSFVFPALPGSQLVSVGVQRVVVRPVDSDVRRMTLDFREPLTTSRALEGLATFGVDVRRDTIDGVNLRFTFEGTGRSRTRTVSLFNPNSSNLSDTPRDRIIRRHLKRWGFDANAAHAAVGPAPLEALAH